ncbi:PpiC-type peptidyl-prolyl cis-trans isomerase [Pseudonocardia sp. Ae707_Ps1]|nr:PpiC-type peptidyl-prolyl cis-trans isomerase [Pseudonocardia sp. Ae707_Ps1]
MSNIVVRDEAAAQQILGDLQGGRPFADVARARSADAATREAGGAIGTLAAAQLEKPFADAAFGAEPNVPFGPVKTQHGWNVGVVSEVQAAVPADLQTVREPLRQRLQVNALPTPGRHFSATGSMTPVSATTTPTSRPIRTACRPIRRL